MARLYGITDELSEKRKSGILAFDGDARGLSVRCQSPRYLSLRAEARVLRLSDRDMVPHPGAHHHASKWQRVLATPATLALGTVTEQPTLFQIPSDQ